ncbi:MAG: ABC transporter permease [Muribaculaceae bacterium]|nr:ABC transporter permease [Muribaculaceae bacterium]
MNKLGIIISNEYRTDIKSKSFWISTFVVPLIAVLFGVFVGLMASESDSFISMQKSITPTPNEEEMTGLKVLGMMAGLFLVIFTMMYGSQIFNKVKVEKCNRIVEVLATCVDGRTLMFAKIISVALIGLTQLLLWFLLIAGVGVVILFISPVDFPWHYLWDSRVIAAFLWSVAFFVGGYIFYGSLFAAVGAMTDKNNENQEYVAVLTFLLLGSFYIGEFAVDNGSSAFAVACSYIPFTSPSVGAVNAITGAVPFWQSLLSVFSLYFFALVSLSLSGKIYTSSLLLKGKRFTLSDIVTFLKSK